MGHNQSKNMPPGTRCTSAASKDVVVGTCQIPASKDEDRFSMDIGSHVEKRIRPFEGFRVMGRDEFLCFGVYDGHGGPKAADLLQKRMHRDIASSSESKNKYETDGVEIRDADICKAYADIDSASKKECEYSGSCATNIFITRREEGSFSVKVSWVGDCRAVIFSGPRWNKGKDLTFDHSLERRDELERVLEYGNKNGGAYISRRIDEQNQAVGPWAIFKEKPKHKGMSLNMTRSIGDLHCSQAIIARPEIVTLTTPKFETTRIVLASDGLWNALSNIAVQRVLNKSADPIEAAKLLARKARRRTDTRRLYKDDITVIVIELKADTSLDATVQDNKSKTETEN